MKNKSNLMDYPRVYVLSSALAKDLEKTVSTVHRINEEKDLDIGLEIATAHLEDISSDIDTYKKMFASYNVSVGTVHASPANNLASEEDDWREKGFNDVYDAIDLAETLGAHTVVVHPGYEFVDKEFEERFGLTDKGRLDIAFESICTLVHYAAEKNIILGFENLNFVGSIDVERLINMVQSERENNSDLNYAKITLDIGHFNLLTRDINSFLHTYSDEITHTHLHYNNGDCDAHNALGQNYSDGTISDYSQAIKHIGALPKTSHTLELHLHNDEFSENVISLEKSVQYLEDAGYFS